MKNNKLEKDYIYCDGYYRQKSLEDAVEVVDKLLVRMINEWNEARRDTSLQQDDVAHEKIDALRDCLYYLTKSDEYNNDIETREKLHEEFHRYSKHGEISEEEFLEIESKEDTKLDKKLQKKKMELRRAGRVIIKERVYGGWAIKYFDRKAWNMEIIRPLTAPVSTKAFPSS